MHFVVRSMAKKPAGKSCPRKWNVSITVKTTRTFPLSELVPRRAALKLCRIFFVHMSAPSECAFVVIVHCPRIT